MYKIIFHSIITMKSSHSIALLSESSSSQNLCYSHLSVIAPEEGGERKSTCVICVLDISGSMDVEATEGSVEESDGFTRLDLVKHSMNTIIHSLSESDCLGIVTFSNYGRVDLQITKMNTNGKEKALSTVRQIKTEGATNLWDGVRIGLQESKSKHCENKNTFVVVLTDGQPNEHPPKGEFLTIQEYIYYNPLSCCMSFFGYGYNLDTQLLSKLAELGGGCYGYIPDCSMVGTIFVNFLSTVLSTFSPSMTVQVSSLKGKLLRINGKEEKQMKLGPIQYGTNRNVLIEFEGVEEGDEFGKVVLKYGDGERKSAEMLLKKESKDSVAVQCQKIRFMYINFLHQIKKECSLEEQLGKVSSLVDKMKSSFNHNHSQYLGRLIRDLNSPQPQEGQVAIALSKQQFWNKWGIHYIPALKIAHQFQICTNFKDPGIQLYAGPTFKKRQNQIDTIFIKLPPPEPTIKKYDCDGNELFVDDMSNYYDVYGGCIASNSELMVKGGHKKKIEELEPNEEVFTSNGQIAKIKCIIETKLSEPVEMVEFPSGLLITKYHPVFIDGKWSFPIHLYPSKKVNIQAYYNFIVEKGHPIIVNGVSCATLGHGLKGEVIEHEYLGSELVIKDLERCLGWNSGRVKMRREGWRRDGRTFRINGILI